MNNPAKPQAQLAKTPVFDEIARRLADRVADLARRPTRGLLVGDAQPISDILSNVYQYIELFSSSNLQSTKPCDLLIGTLPLGADVPQILAAALPLLAPDAPILLSLIGDGSFAELPSPPRFPDVRDLGGLVQKMGLVLPVIDRDKLTLTFATPEAAQRTFKAHGWPPINMNISKLTIEIIYVHAHTCGANQPLPARRGSGKISLVKILHNNSDT